MYSLIIKIFLLAFLWWLTPEIAHAGFLDDVAYCTATGDCGFQDIAVGFSSLIRLLLGGFGAVALVYFVWGGIQWLVSGGNLEKVARGRTIMINTVFAMILAFGSYILVNFFVNDFLNVKPDFQIQEGEFTSCFDAPAGSPCGDSRQCAGNLALPHPHAELSGKCIYNCQAANLTALVLPVCIDANEAGGLQEISGPNLCPNNQKCVIPASQ